LRAQLRIWPATNEANRTEFPLPINVTNIPNASTANQPGFLVKARKQKGRAVLIQVPRSQPLTVRTPTALGYTHDAPVAGVRSNPV
jgi:hypothetical protein